MPAIGLNMRSNVAVCLGSGHHLYTEVRIGRMGIPCPIGWPHEKDLPQDAGFGGAQGPRSPRSPITESKQPHLGWKDEPAISASRSSGSRRIQAPDIPLVTRRLPACRCPGRYVDPPNTVFPTSHMSGSRSFPCFPSSLLPCSAVISPPGRLLTAK